MYCENCQHFLKTLYNFRLLSNGSFATQFHTYGLQWLPTGINFLIDNVTIGGISPPVPGGFWKLNGASNGTNIWANGTTMAPFDKRVVSLKFSFLKIVICINIFSM